MTQKFQAAAELAAKIEQDPETYLTKLIFTLQIQKNESEWQKPDQPPIYLKSYDELGLIELVEVNSSYATTVPMLIGITPKQQSYWLDVLEQPDITATLDVMLLANRLESKLTSTIDQTELEKPIIVRVYDAKGLPTGFYAPE